MEHAAIAVDQGLAVISLLLLASIIASKVSDRFGVPALLLFLAVGMLAGSEGPGGIYFDNYGLAQTLGIIALAFILFSGGLSTSWESVRPILGQGLSLATVGTLLTAVLTGAFAVLVLKVTWAEGLLLGSIVSSTDAAAVLSVLSAGSIKVKKHIPPLLELESGTNDPMAVFLTLGAISVITNPSTSVASLLSLLVVEMALGLVLGFALGRVMVFVINRIRLGHEGLYTVLTVALVLLVFGGTQVVGGSGFLAVYVAGMVLGNHAFVHKRSLLNFHSSVAWLMQIAMFLVLGLLVFPHQLLQVAEAGLLFTAFLMFVARPLSVFLALAPAKTGWREKTFLSWVGLRGAVPIILATYPLLAGIQGAGQLFNIVFFVVLVSVLLQGTTIAPVARVLGLEETPAPKFQQPPIQVTGQDLCQELRELTVAPGSVAEGKSLVDLPLPEGFLVVLVNRHGEYIVPNGGTVLNTEDKLLVLGEPEPLAKVAAELVSVQSV